MASKDKIELLEKELDEIGDRLKESEAKQRQQEIDDGIADGINKRVRAVCMTATSALLGAFYWMGDVAYTKYPAIKAGIIAFLAADKGTGQ